MARSRRVAASAVTALAAGATARAAYAALTRFPPGGAARWTRTNHRGEPVTLLEGPAAAIAGTVAAAAAPGVPGRCRAAMAVAAAGAAAFGGYDDIAGSGDRRGFRGHLGALAHGEVTTGAVKIGGIGATGIAAAAVNGGPAADVAINAALVAGTANLLNLFDLRPGRAIKVVLAAGGPLAAAGAPVAAPLGAALALLPEDLGERAMLGDAGANALGAMLGAASAGRLSRTSRLALLAGVTALTAASEVVSFTKVIQRTPALNWLDMLGRRPPAVPAAAPPATAAPGTAAPGTASPATGSPATGPSTMGSPAMGPPAGAAEPEPEPVPGAGPHFP